MERLWSSLIFAYGLFLCALLSHAMACLLMIAHTEPPLFSALLLTSSGESWELETLVWYTDHTPMVKDVSEKLEVSFDKNNRVHSKLTVGLTEAGFTTVFSSLQNVCRATHTSFLFSSHTRTLQLLLLSLVNWENINVFLQHTPVHVSQT